MALSRAFLSLSQTSMMRKKKNRSGKYITRLSKENNFISKQSSSEGREAIYASDYRESNRNSNRIHMGIFSEKRKTAPLEGGVIISVWRRYDYDEADYFLSAVISPIVESMAEAPPVLLEMSDLSPRPEVPPLI